MNTQKELKEHLLKAVKDKTRFIVKVANEANFLMACVVEEKIDIGDYQVRFTYTGPNNHPKWSKLLFDGGDSKHWGSSSKNPKPEDYRTLRDPDAAQEIHEKL